LHVAATAGEREEVTSSSDASLAAREPRLSGRCLMRFVPVVVIASVLLSGAKGLAAQAAHVATVGTAGEIPRDGFSSWSLFLVCNPGWVNPEKSGDLANLYLSFKAFGDAIGRDNLAVWFAKKETSIGDPDLARNVDVARAAEFCKALKLRPSRGPFLVITTEYPDLKQIPRDRVVYELGGLGSRNLQRLLDKLTDELLLSEKAPLEGMQPLPAPPFWVRLLEGARKSMNGFGCKLKLRIDTGAFSAELRECSQG
jgi:hypothetical protein